MEYEFTVMLDIDMQHIASASKDRTGLFDGRYFKITTETGKTLLAWLDSGIEAPKPEAKPEPEAIVVAALHVGHFITEEQAAGIETMLTDAKIKYETFCAKAGVDKIRKLTAADYAGAIAWITRQAQKVKERGRRAVQELSDMPDDVPA
jgi:hypothetical protein